MHALIDTVGSVVPLIQAGKIRALGVSSAERVRCCRMSRRSRDRTGLQRRGWLGIGAPKDTPAEIVQRLNREINAVLNEAAIKSKMADSAAIRL